jgi:hypothetical protein
LASVQKFSSLQTDLDLTAMRKESELAKLSKEEQSDWKSLWTEFNDVMLKLQSEFPVSESKGNLTAAQPEQVHDVKMRAGRVYLIDMASASFDTYLRLEDSKSNVLAFNDDISAKDLNSRIIFTARTDGNYRVVATSYQNAGRGPYTLRIAEFKTGVRTPTSN